MGVEGYWNESEIKGRGWGDHDGSVL